MVLKEASYPRRNTIFARAKTSLKTKAPELVVLLVRMMRDPERIIKNPGDFLSVMRFLRESVPHMSLREKLSLVHSFYSISYSVDCPHTESEMLSFITTILKMPSEVAGCVVEAGCYKGGSTAKFSLAVKLTGRQLVVFDSFEGLPDNDEVHERTILGEIPNFQKGRYCGHLDEVKQNVAGAGAPDVCRFVPGWFENTMPHFSEPIAAIYLDVDLVSSTKTCLKYLYPLLSPGGYVFSQDGHLPLVIDALQDDEFWQREVGFDRPSFLGLGTKKLVMARKPPE